MTNTGEEEGTTKPKQTEIGGEDEITAAKNEGPENQKSSNEQPFASEDPSSDLSEDEPPPKKQKNLSLPTPGSHQKEEIDQCGDEAEQSELKSNGLSKSHNVWTKPASRKGKKKTMKAEDSVLIAPAARIPDKGEDSAEMKIRLSEFYKAEKVELSEDRLCAGSCKGYKTVRATRGVSEGAWYFEIKVLCLGETGHTRLGWITERGDLQGPVGYDADSYGYRDVDGSKVHKALRVMYGEDGYKEGDVIGFYIHLPEQPDLVLYKGQRYVSGADHAKEDPPNLVPGSEMSFFKNGVCQGVAFTDLRGGRYYPAASMYTLPNQPNCQVKFNFGPDFECFPEDFGGRPLPAPMIEIPYQGFDS